MTISARLAHHSAAPSHSPQLASGADSIRPDYHGSNVVLRKLSPNGFVADPSAGFKSGSIVRLRLPGAGVMVAKLIKANRRQLSGEFVNPVSAARLAMVLGIKTLHSAG
jgi:hypothetical protein